MGLLNYKTHDQTIVWFCPGPHMGQEPLEHGAWRSLPSAVCSILGRGPGSGWVLQHVEGQGLCPWSWHQINLGQQSQLCPAVAVWLWASHCTSLGLKFPICKWAQESPHCPVMREEVKDLIYVKSSEVTPSASSQHRALHTIGTQNVMSCYCYRYYFKTAFSTFPVPRTN